MMLASAGVNQCDTSIQVYIVLSNEILLEVGSGLEFDRREDGMA